MTMNWLINRRHTMRAGLLYALGSQAVHSSPTTPGQADPTAFPTNDWIRASDPRFAGGAKGDGATDDTAALAAAAAAAAATGRPLYMPGNFAVANLELTGVGHPLHIVGDPTFIQARRNTPCLRIRRNPLQQIMGCKLDCTVVPHPGSEKENPGNVAIDLTGFSASDIAVRLGRAASGDGRFHTVVYADSASPFHYGNHIRLVANAVPAPKFGIRYGNRGKGVVANPNLNVVSGWFTDLDTVAGDILIDVGDTTQTIVGGPSLFEACPRATAIKLGNFTTVEDAWFESVGVALDMLGTQDTTPNDCRIQRCNFSGAGHVVRIASDLGAPPVFDECLNDSSVTYRDQQNRPLRPASRSRARAQPSAPSIGFTLGPGRIVPDQASLRQGIDRSGRTTFQLRYLVTPASAGPATMRLTPPPGYAIEQASMGIRDGGGTKLAWALGDDLAGRDYDWTWSNVSQHILNIRVTLVATDT